MFVIFNILGLKLSCSCFFSPSHVENKSCIFKVRSTKSKVPRRCVRNSLHYASFPLGSDLRLVSVFLFFFHICKFQAGTLCKLKEQPWQQVLADVVGGAIFHRYDFSFKASNNPSSSFERKSGMQVEEHTCCCERGNKTEYMYFLSFSSIMVLLLFCFWIRE